VSRVLRIFNALRIFKEIRLMVDSLAGSLAFFFWCAIMLGLFLSLFGICFVQAVTDGLEESNDLSDDLRKSLMNDFGSVSQAMLSLILALTGSSAWGDQYNEIKTTGGSIFSWMYLFFILFSIIAFFNVITSVFCEKAMSLADHHTVEEKMLVRQRKRYHDASELLKMLSTLLKDDGTQQLDCDRFEEFLSHPRAVGYFEMKGLNESSARRFFRQLLEVYQASRIDFGTFASACVKLDGSVSTLDSYMLGAQIKAMRLAQARFQHRLGELLSTGCHPLSGAPSKDLFKAKTAFSPEAPRVFAVPTPCRRQPPADALNMRIDAVSEQHASNFNRAEDGIYHVEESDALGLRLETDDGAWSDCNAHVSPQRRARIPQARTLATHYSEESDALGLRLGTEQPATRISPARTLATHGFQESDALGLRLGTEDSAWSDCNADVSPQAAIRMYPYGEYDSGGVFGFNMSI
jgi:hypothetical protein